jgi:hypothetical protein
MPAENESGALKAARATVARAKLRFPAVPQDLQGSFRKYSNWWWGTLEAPVADAFAFEVWGQRVLSERVEHARRTRYRGIGNLAMLGYAGRGEGLMALTWVLVRRPLEIVLQVAWGGPQSDDAAARKAWDDVIAASDELLDLVPAGDPSPARPLTREFDRFVVAGSQFYGAGRLEDFGELAPFDPKAPPPPALPPSTFLGPRVFIGNPDLILPAALARARACRVAGTSPAAGA